MSSLARYIVLSEPQFRPLPDLGVMPPAASGFMPLPPVGGGFSPLPIVGGSVEDKIASFVRPSPHVVAGSAFTPLPPSGGGLKYVKEPYSPHFSETGKRIFKELFPKVIKV